MADIDDAIATIRENVGRHGPVRAEFVDDHGFHELMVEMDGSLTFNAYAGDPVPLATTLEELPEPVIRRLLAACAEPGRT